jgi:hypothetical protein
MRRITVVAVRFKGGWKGRDAEAEPRRERRVAKEIKRKGIVLRHERLLSNGRTPKSRRQQARRATRMREGEG